MGKIKEFTNSFEDWHETHFSIVEEMTKRLLHFNKGCKVSQRYSEQGRGGMYEMAQELTDKFEMENKDVVWGEDIDYTDTLEEFLDREL